jgi:hypothetical protein
VITAREELAHVIETMTEAEAERALEALRAAGLLGEDADDADQPAVVTPPLP